MNQQITLFRAWLGAVSVVLFLSGGPTVAQAPFSDAEQNAIEQMIRSYILTNPEIIVESVQRMGARDQAAKQQRQKQALAELRQSLENDPGSHVGGNPNGDITVVEFFDYRCTYCKRFLTNLADLMRTDTNVRIVFKEHPILGPDSLMASRAALAARAQDRDLYLPFHSALMESRGAFSENRIFNIAREVGLNTDQLKQDMDSPEIENIISRNYAEAETLGIQGTPGFVIGDRVIRGYIDREQLAALVKEARAGCTTC
jgi:protein-disulfide isomerase